MAWIMVATVEMVSLHVNLLMDWVCARGKEESDMTPRFFSLVFMHSSLLHADLDSFSTIY